MNTEVHDMSHMRRLAPHPTTALPGTPEKVEVMRQREECGYDIWHPDDATYSSTVALMRCRDLLTGARYAGPVRET